MGDVVRLNCITTLDIPADDVLDGAKGNLESAVLFGIDKDGCEYFASTYGDAKEVLWLLELAKIKLFELLEE